MMKGAVPSHEYLRGVSRVCDGIIRSIWWRAKTGRNGMMEELYCGKRVYLVAKCKSCVATILIITPAVESVIEITLGVHSPDSFSPAPSGTNLYPAPRCETKNAGFSGFDSKYLRRRTMKLSTLRVFGALCRCHTRSSNSSRVSTRRACREK